MKRIAITSLAVGAALGVVLLAQSRGTPNNLRVRIDSLGAIVTAASAQTGTVTSCQFSNCRLAVDSSGNLLTVISGGTGVGTVTSLTATSPVTITPSPTTTTGVIACPTCGITVQNVSQFASTNSATFAGTIDNETGFSAGTGLLVFSNQPTFLTSIESPLIIGGTGTTSTLTFKTTTGVGTTGADHIFLTGNNGATEAMRLTNSGNLGLNTGTVSGGIAARFHPVITAASGTVALFDKYQDGVNAPGLFFRSARGTPAAPTKTLSGDGLMVIAGRGYQETSSAFSGNVGSLSFTATQDFTNANQGTQAILQVTPTNSTTPANQLVITSTSLTFGSMVTPASTGTRYLCISTAGVVTSSATACSGT